jgi:outer membrane protein assembly factor BamB
MPRYNSSLSNSSSLWITTLLLILASLTATNADDWPQWRHDAERSAATSNPLPESPEEPLHLTWRYDLPTPTPAWPESQPSLRFDVSYSPVAAEGLLFVPSMRDDSVRAIDLETGEIRWRYTTDGPIRLAPAYSDGRLYVGSDDGRLYCLDAQDGTELWRFEAGPRQRRILGNERLISTWPVRTCPTVIEDRIYFSAGVWPFMGVFYHCLDAQSGELVWSNTAESSNYIENPHGAYAFSGLTPRGYPALIDWSPDETTPSKSVLAIPGGRTPPGLFDLETGGLLDFQWAKNGSRAWNVTGDGREITAGEEIIRVESHPLAEEEDLILIGERFPIFLGDRVWSLLAVDGKLLVVTESGKILCYGEGTVRDQETLASESKPAIPQTPPNEKTQYVLFLADGLDDLSQLNLLPNERGILLDTNPDSVAAIRAQLLDESRYGIDMSVYCGRIEDLDLPQYFAKRIVVLPSAMPDADQYGTRSEFIHLVWESLHPYIGTAQFPITSTALAWVCNDIPDGEALLQDAQFGDSDQPLSLLTRSGGILNAGDWTHQYANAANTVVTNDDHIQAPLGLLWFGNGPPNDEVLPRHGHGPSPQVAEGRLVIEGADMLRSYDIYTGLPLWQRDLPGLGQFYDNTSHHPGANEIGSNYVTTPDAVFVLNGEEILQLDPASGVTEQTFTCPASSDENSGCWGMLAVEGDRLIATATPLGVLGENDESDDPLDAPLQWPSAFGATRYSSASARLVVMDRMTGETLWTRDAKYGFRHNNIAASGDRLYVIDALSEAKLDAIDRRGLSVESYTPSLHAVDLNTGDILWETEEHVFGTFLNYSAEHDILLQSGSRARDRASDESGVGMVARQGASGEILWRELNRSFTGPCLLLKDRIITQGPAYSLLTGEGYFRINPITGEVSPWVFTRNYGCNTVVGSQRLLTFRSGAAGFYDLQSDGGTSNLGGFKSSCTSNLIPAGGLLNAPDYTRTCICNYQNQTSLALMHDPSVEQWSFVPYGRGSEPIKRLGFNFGAPGDRLADDGVLWVDTPSGGSSSPDAGIEIEAIDGAELSYFRIHTEYVDVSHTKVWTYPDDDTIELSSVPHIVNPTRFVCASGVEGVGRISMRLDEPVDDPAEYLVTLYLLEPNVAMTRTRFTGERTSKFVFEKVPAPERTQQVEAGERVFDIRANGRKIHEQFDTSLILSPDDPSIVSFYSNVNESGELVIELQPADGSLPPILCGIEVVRK